MKKTKIIITIFLNILILLSIYVQNEVQAKYVLEKNTQISYTTSDYYFDATVDATEILAFPVTLTVTAKNNDGTNYTNEDLTYTIGVDNSNYTVTATGGNTRTLTGGSKQEESYTITIEKTGTDDSESINLTFTVSKPYSDSRTVNLDISTILYENILNYANGARVTYVSPTPYNCSSSSYVAINGRLYR